MKKYTAYILPAIAVLMLAFAIKTAFNAPEREVKVPNTPPPTSEYKDQVAGIGITEPQSENISLGTNLPGIITDVYVQVGTKVKKGDKLFTIDSRETVAQLEQAKAQVDLAKVEYADAKQQLDMFKSIRDSRAISEDQLKRREYAAQVAAAKIKLNESQVKVLETNLDRMTVTAPINGTILKVNARPGEYAQTMNMAGTTQPLMIMGDIETMHVRVEVDETVALNIKPGATAIATLRGYGKKSEVKLAYVKTEPYVLPKRQLTGDGNERVDSRVMQVVYSFDNKNLNALVGQQMDVFIKNGQ